MKNPQQQLNAMYARVRQVFPLEMLDSMAPQQRTLTDNAINRVLNKDGVEALTLDRLEGIKELVTQHLWSDAHTAAFKSSQPSAMETSETSDSTQAKLPNSKMQPAESSSASEDLMSLPEDPALGAIRAAQSSEKEEGEDLGALRIARFKHQNEQMRKQSKD